MKKVSYEETWMSFFFLGKKRNTKIKFENKNGKRFLFYFVDARMFPLQLRLLLLLANGTAQR